VSQSSALFAHFASVRAVLAVLLKVLRSSSYSVFELPFQVVLIANLKSLKTGQGSGGLFSGLAPRCGKVSAAYAQRLPLPD
jgi:hypothetical protein